MWFYVAGLFLGALGARQLAHNAACSRETGCLSCKTSTRGHTDVKENAAITGRVESPCLWKVHFHYVIHEGG
jgi:hypothetical protein